jgi:hypothetical protein
MPIEFYTERDIEDMVRRGIRSLELNGNVVLTDLAYEKAKKLGLQLVQNKPDVPPAAPIRPYISQQHAQPPARAEPKAGPPASSAPSPQPSVSTESQFVPPSQAGDLRQRIRKAVTAGLGNQVDPVLLETIITRVLASTGIK